MTDSDSLTKTEARQRLQEMDYPGRSDEIREFHKQAVTDCYMDIRGVGEREDHHLLAHAPSPPIDKPDDGLFTDQRLWLKEVVRPVLEDMPDIRVPRGTFPSWRWEGERSLGETTHSGSSSAAARAKQRRQL